MQSYVSWRKLYVVKNYVYSHPVNVFIIGRLGLSVEVFCELYGFKQGLCLLGLPGKTVASLPIEFLHGLSLASGRLWIRYMIVCVLEQEYIEYKIANELRKGRSISSSSFIYLKIGSLSNLSLLK